MIPKKLTDEIERWIMDKKYGNLQVNFVAGKIVNVNRTESLKVEMLVKNSPDFNITASINSTLDA